MFVGAYIDIVVRVLHVSTSENKRTRLIIWDGSGNASPTPENSCAKVLQGNSVDVPRHGVLREIVFDSCWELLQTFGFTEELLLSHWCRFRNLHIADEDDQSLLASSAVNTAVLRFREGASVMFVPEFVQDVRDRLELVTPASLPSTSRELESRTDKERHDGVHDDGEPDIPKGTAPRMVQTVVPEFIRRDVPVTSLRDVLRNEMVPRKFHCLARFTRFWPSDVTKLTKLQPGTDSTFVYSFVIRLEDDTDLIDVIVYGKDAVRRNRVWERVSCPCSDGRLSLVVEHRNTSCRGSHRAT